MKYAFVERNRRQYGVPALCEALQVSRSGYYAARHRGPSERQKRQVELTARIRTIHQASRESYGAPRVHVELLAQEVPCCRNTVAKLMHKAGILPKAIRRFRVTTDSRRTKASLNLINRDFTSTHPNDLWLTDITTSPPGKAGSTWPQFWTCTREPWWAGRWAGVWTRSWRWTH